MNPLYLESLVFVGQLVYQAEEIIEKVDNLRSRVVGGDKREVNDIRVQN